MSAVVIIPRVIYYKKEDIKGVLVKSRRNAGLFSILIAGLFIFLTAMTYPNVVETYEFLKTTPPMTTTIALAVVGLCASILVIYGLYLLFTKVNSEEIDQKLEKYSEGEMVSMEEFTDKKFMFLVIALTAVMTIALFFGVVSPVLDAAYQTPNN